MEGKVKFFNNRHGFGFITGDDGKDAYVRYSDIVGEKKHKTLTADERVSYDIDNSDERGPKAVNVVEL